MKLPPLPELPNDLDWEAVKKLGDECDEAAVLIYGPEVAARMRVAATLLRGMPKMMEDYALAYGWAVRQACAKEAESPRHIPLDALGSEMMTSVLRRYFGAIAAAIRSQEGE